MTKTTTRQTDEIETIISLITGRPIVLYYDGAAALNEWRTRLDLEMVECELNNMVSLQTHSTGTDPRAGYQHWGLV